ncbi:hypothetical protein KIPB_008157, partial [Kipferlia bialata]
VPQTLGSAVPISVAFSQRVSAAVDLASDASDGTWYDGVPRPIQKANLDADVRALSQSVIDRPYLELMQASDRWSVSALDVVGPHASQDEIAEHVNVLSGLCATLNAKASDIVRLCQILRQADCFASLKRASRLSLRAALEQTACAHALCTCEVGLLREGLVSDVEALFRHCVSQWGREGREVYRKADLCAIESFYSRPSHVGMALKLLVETSVASTNQAMQQGTLDTDAVRDLTVSLVLIGSAFRDIVQVRDTLSSVLGYQSVSDCPKWIHTLGGPLAELTQSAVRLLPTVLASG